MTGHAMPDPEPWVQQEGALATIDAAVGRGGVLFVDAPDGELRALASHIARRADRAGRELALADGASAAEPWLDVALQLGIEATDATSVARAIAAAGDAVIVVIEAAASRWGASVCLELERHARARTLAPAVFVLAHRAPTTAPSVTLGRVSEAESVRFYDALVETGRARATTFGQLAEIEAWWNRGKQLRSRGPSDDSKLLAARLALLGRSASTQLVAELGSEMALGELLASGQARMLRRRVQLLTAQPEHVEPAAAQAVADALLRHERDAWALLRVAELRRAAGCPDFKAAMEALRAAPDAASRGDLWRRIDLGDDGVAISTAAEVALECGDSEQALELARRAGARGERTFKLAMVLAMACRARGDLTAAAVALEGAATLSAGAADEAALAVEGAEQRLSGGDLAGAREQASHALEGSAAARLAARNVIGKVFLSEGRWDEAERHFASDEHDAATAMANSERLRARLNRAIAVMSAGRRSEARALLESVLEEGQKHGDRRARAFALANLSTFATDAHDYGEAIALLERAIDDVRALGDQPRLARLIANLAELRLRVGLLDEAEQALAFARQASGPTPGGPTAALLSYVAAHARLARGQTLQAAAEIEEAMAAALRSSNGGKLSQCCRLATRIALEDGDVARAQRYLARAEAAGRYHDSEADIALLRGFIERAAGRSYADLATIALDRALECGDVELTRQAHVLCYIAARDDGADHIDGTRHLELAFKLRDSLAAALPNGLRQSYLARRDFCERARSERESVAPATLPPPKASQPARPLAQAMDQIVGSGDAMIALKSAIAKIGRSDATVLIGGESGTGKELVADAIHAASSRAGGPLVKINCAALVETLLLSELFGHEKGAFTGAHAKRRGRFEQADGGTIFLDEIGDISPNTQVSLLRVLQERTFERVGGSTPVRVDVRVICATHRDLSSMVAQGTFREDLYYRLCGVTLSTPALRDRTEDLPALCEALLERMSRDEGQQRKRLGREALEALSRHRWPGNVRELQNALRAAALFADEDIIQLTDLTRNVSGLEHLEGPPPGPVSRVREIDASPTEVVYNEIALGRASLPELKRQLEKACIERALDEAGGNITKAAQLLGMKRPRLSQLVNQYARGVVGEDEEVAS
jgi:DNA-binding NtrC family response regulator